MRKLVWVISVGTLAACSRGSTPPHVTSTSAPTTSSQPPVTSVAPPATAEEPEDKVPDIEYVPTPQNVVDKMLDVAALSRTDVLYDLGCGDGRIVITAAKKFGIRAHGFDVDPERIQESRENAKNAGVADLVTFEKKDVFTVDLSPASVVTLYLLPELNVRLVPQLQKLKPGSRIISHDFDMEGVKYDKWWTVMAPDHRPPHKDREHYVYLWKAPLKMVKATGKK